MLDLCTERPISFLTFNEEKNGQLTRVKLQRAGSRFCLLSDKDSCSLNNTWVATGFIDCANLSRAVERHSKSKCHILCSKIEVVGINEAIDFAEALAQWGGLWGTRIFWRDSLMKSCILYTQNQSSLSSQSFFFGFFHCRLEVKQSWLSTEDLFTLCTSFLPPSRNMHVLVTLNIP